MLHVKWLKRLILISYFLITLLYIELLTHYKIIFIIPLNYRLFYFTFVSREHEAHNLKLKNKMERKCLNTCRSMETLPNQT